MKGTDLRIAHVFFSYPNRYQPYNQLLIKRMQMAGLDCKTFSFTGKGLLQAGNIESLSRLRKFRYLLNALTKLPQVISFKESYDYTFLQAALVYGRFSYLSDVTPELIHVHHIQLMSDDFLHFLEFKDIPWVVSLRGYEVSIRPLLSSVDYEIVRERLLKAYGVHAVAQNLKERAIAMGVPAQQIHVIRRTVEIDKPIQNTASFDQRPFSITVIARFNWVKGIIFVLQAIRMLLDKQVLVALNLCGDGDEKERAEVRYWIWLLKLEQVVLLHGFLESDALTQVLEKTHIYIQPSINEGIPNTLLRVLISRIPIIASNVGGIPEVVEDEVNGLLVPPGNPIAIADAVVKILSDHELRIRLVNSSMKNISLDFMKEVEDYKVFYSQVLKGIV